MSETVKQSKLVQYLSEAYGKEKELETALEAHISITTRKPYRSRLEDHLKETKAHARERRAPDQEDRGLAGRSSPSGSPARRRGR